MGGTKEVYGRALWAGSLQQSLAHKCKICRKVHRCLRNQGSCSRLSACLLQWLQTVKTKDSRYILGFNKITIISSLLDACFSTKLSSQILEVTTYKILAVLKWSQIHLGSTQAQRPLSTLTEAECGRLWSQPNTAEEVTSMLATN